MRERSAPHPSAVAVRITAGADHKMLRHKARLRGNAQHSTPNAQLPTVNPVSRIKDPVSAFGALAIVRNDVVPLVSRRAGDECDHRFLRLLYVERFVFCLCAGADTRMAT